MANDKIVSTVIDPSSVRRNWRIGGSRSGSDGLYALAIIDTEFVTAGTTAGALVSGGVLGNGGASIVANSGQDAIEFVFKMNPQSMSMNEPAAVQIVPTQDGSQFIEHQGSIYKDITIAGTTGLRPSKKSAPLIPVLNIPNPFSGRRIDPETLLPDAEKTQSGFEDLILLKNMFRHYFDIKRNPTIAHRHVMVWQNGKEGEWWIVEPMAFKTNRDSGSPLTTKYDIQLRTIKRYDLRLFQRPIESRKKRNGFTRLNVRLAEATRRIANSLSVATALSDRTVGVTQATLNNIIGPAKALFDGLTGVTTVSSRAFLVPRNTTIALAQSALGLMAELQSSQAALNAYKQDGVSTQLSTAWHAYRMIFRVSTAVAAEDALYGETTGHKFSKRNRAYNNPASGPPRTGGSPTNVSNTKAPGGTQIAAVTSFDTIFTLAQRYLGDQARWKELVLLNDLKAPYIDPTGNGSEVLRPGDQILVPSHGIELQSGVELDLSQETDLLTKRLGRDLRLSSFDAAGGVTDFDLVVNSRGDIDTISGVPNLEQAVEIKFSTEQGTLPTHPAFGLQVPIGSKANIRTLIGFQLNARASLLADSRISDVNRLNFRVEGNTVTVNAELQVADVNESLAVSFDARR